jgi:ubiquinone/menaquinone biosynthesis C-methylase UbiE
VVPSGEPKGSSVNNPKAKAAAVYNAAADYFDDPALAFWERFGEGTVDRLGLRTGASVLDVCAGSGASAIPAALRVGSGGQVVAVDLAEGLVALGVEKARRLGLGNVEFLTKDLESLTHPAESFDAVVIVFGIFFLPDWHAALALLWRMVKPGGQLAVTTWGPGVFEPGSSVFWDEVATIRPGLHRAYNPWDELTDPHAVRELLTRAGAEQVLVEEVSSTHPLRSPEDFWAIVLGTGYRATYDAMTQDEQRDLQRRVVAELTRLEVTKVQTDVIYAIARKPDRQAR